MTDHDPAPTGPAAAPTGPAGAAAPAAPGGEPLWEVFVRPRRGLAHGHVGSLHAADATIALRHARDLYTRRQEGVSIWVVPAGAITASSPDEKDAFFDPAADKVYRHPTFYDVPEGVSHL
ncbi:phenylacetate-CoA oxygenase subunit PaaB [Pilimelia anulata]|uniref:Phenylacetate-CoA oxygenase subunit PaaB n=1 Tax=Pilimelia anulata TaxID=53371 RepID=A0A8J3FA16_9ACTN|nr:1,2-phenylacetyl-CoA epoxidase subunit PaaB [Pilimelia anulata]GGJ95332.1 phenylacetate-CoA oxygenase subunit PaaB [Pilimelia anulata]